MRARRIRLEIARRTGAKLTGVDFSQVAIERARERAAGRADFRLGELTATGLPDAFAAAVVCVDAMQFPEPYEAGIAECARILRPGGRLVLTGWEVTDVGGDTVPARLCRDIGAALRAGGFVDVTVTHMPTWLAAERAHWAAAVDLDPAGDLALESMRNEGLRVREWLDRARRVLAIGLVRAPS
ncbi:MAG TPA: methyltransferase domain-containing protein [Jatrophihabitans sp.]|nr:methyltransferase domain-containing protein [Jatrophihabitans sp.]